MIADATGRPAAEWTNGDWLVGAGRCGFCARVLGDDEPQRRVSGVLACHRDALSGGGVVGSHRGLVDRQPVRVAGLPLRVETSTVRSEGSLDANGGADATGLAYPRSSPSRRSASSCPSYEAGVSAFSWPASIFSRNAVLK